MADATGPIPKVVLAFVILAVALGIASLVLNILILSKENEKQELSVETTSRPTFAPTPQPTVSNSTGFKEAAEFLLKGLDFNFDPCEDFYMFTCNKYLNANPLPSGTNRIGTYSDTQRQVNNAVALALNTSDNLLSNTEKILQKVFTSCMTLPSAGRSARVYQAMVSTFNGFPMLDQNWSEAGLTDADFWKGIGTLELHYGMASLLQSYVSVDYKNISRNALFIDQLPLMMARDYYVKPHFIDYLDTYLDSLIDTLRQFKADIQSTVPDETIVQEATEATDLELSLALASVPSDLLRNFEQQYNPYTLAELRTAYPSIGWDAYLGAIIEQGTPSNDKYIIQQPSYFGTLNTILAGKQYSKRTLVNFVMMRFLQNNLDFLGNGTDQYSRLFEIIRGGQGGTKKRPQVAAWEDQAYSCVSLTEDLMPYANGYVYLKGIDANLRDNVRKDIAKQTEYVIEQFLEMIATLSWLTSTSLDSARTKAQGLIKNYGWPDWFDFNDPASIDAYHIHYNSILNMSDWWDITNALQYASQVTENFGTLEKEPDRYNFLQSPAAVNAWYQPERNSITLPFAILNPPYYRYDFPQAYNYGGQGGVAGHELTHGYDDEGVQFGPRGELYPCVWNRCGWMDKNSTSGFINMAQCVVSQYSEQCCPLKTGNVHCASGERTQGENIADIGGQLASYKAYRHYIAVERNGVEEDRLPGLEQFTPNQIFWITYGYTWCINMSTEYLTRLLLTNPHAPGMCRVNQVVQDIPEFGEDFNCQRGSSMYPPDTQRCQVWTGQ
uniref:Peptidase M13 C-terminal domain-containing protein n=2 Tax=Ascaris TaxID=6251 RepID=A0A9J2PB65_ASCLU